MQDSKSDRWFIYKNGELLLKIIGDISEEIITLTIMSPFIPEIETAGEIFLRQSFMDWEFRKLFENIHIKKKNDVLYLVKTIVVNKRKKNFQLYLSDQINIVINDSEKLSQTVLAKIDLISQIKLN